MNLDWAYLAENHENPSWVKQCRETNLVFQILQDMSGSDIQMHKLWMKMIPGLKAHLFNFSVKEQTLAAFLLRNKNYDAKYLPCHKFQPCVLHFLAAIEGHRSPHILRLVRPPQLNELLEEDKTLLDLIQQYAYPCEAAHKLLVEEGALTYQEILQKSASEAAETAQPQESKYDH